jgi:hypothetical protein
LVSTAAKRLSLFHMIACPHFNARRGLPARPPSDHCRD